MEKMYLQYRKKSDVQMEKESGNVVVENRLTVFLYLLMKNELVPGKVQEIINLMHNPEKKYITNESSIFTNGWLAQYADYLRKLIETK